MQGSILILGIALLSGPHQAFARQVGVLPEFLPCSPTSDFINTVADGEPDQDFCATWNPDYVFNGHRCCARKGYVRGRKRNKCAPNRFKTSYCDEMTPEQRTYYDAAKAGRLGDLLPVIAHDIGKQGEQAYCTVNNGFLARGRALVSTSYNRIRLRNGFRCLDFGTDGLVGMLEWAGHQVAHRYSDPEYSGVRLLVGDIAAPRGGCLWGRHGRRGHASHTSGLDVDVGFLTVKAGSESPGQFHRHFDPTTNWWLIKKIFSNPFACVRAIFLDRHLIRKLAKVARDDPEWDRVRRFIKHIPHHKNHMHVRVGEFPGPPGCGFKDDEDLREEMEEQGDTLQTIEASPQFKFSLSR